MKKKLLLIVTVVTLLTFPKVNFGQVPDLGVASSFALFTAAGAFSNEGATIVTGDIGTNAGAFTGFPPGIVIGETHVADDVSAQAAADVAVAYSYLDGLTCGEVLGTGLGEGQILTPNIYCLGAASTINGELILDAQGDPGAVFIFQIDGALSTTTLSTITLINGASLCNVYFQVNGAVELGVSSVFQGNILATGAISLLDDATLLGSALSTAGAIALHNNTVTLGTQPTASPIFASGATTFCAGDSVIISGNDGGVFSNGATTPSITVTTGGDYFVTNTNACGSDTSNHIIVAITPLPTAATLFASGPTKICPGDSVVISGNVDGTFSNGATTPSITVTTGGDYFVTNTNACGSVTSNHILVKVKPFCGGFSHFCFMDNTGCHYELDGGTISGGVVPITGTLTTHPGDTFAITGTLTLASRDIVLVAVDLTPEGCVNTITITGVFFPSTTGLPDIAGGTLTTDCGTSRDIRLDGVVCDHSMKEAMPSALTTTDLNVYQGSEAAVIVYTTPKGQVNISVYNQLGHKVATLINEETEAGTYTLTWKGTSSEVGYYIVSMNANGTTVSRPFVNASIK